MSPTNILIQVYRISVDYNMSARESWENSRKSSIVKDNIG